MSQKYTTGDENLNLEQESLRQMLFEDEPEEEDDLITGQTFTKIEMLHNVALCYIMEEKYDEAIEHLEKMIHMDSNNLIYQEEFEDILKNSLKPSVSQLIQILVKGKLDFGKSSGKKKQNSENENGSQENTSNPENDAEQDPSQPLYVNIFPTVNRLCGIYEPVLHSLKSSKTDPKQQIQLRPSFCLPYIAPPSMSIRVSFEILENINVECVENRPEAPWIRRSSAGIIFTNNILEKEAYLVSDVNELLNEIKEGKETVVNTRVKLNAERIFDDIRRKE